MIHQRATIRIGVGFGLTLAVAIGCASRSAVPVLQPEEVAEVESAGNFPHGSYLLEPGDRLKIQYTFHSELDQEEIIRPDGKIRASEVGEVIAAGYTTSDLERQLVRLTSDRLREPEVVVSVLEFAPRSIYVAGEVARPGPILYRKGLTPLQAITEAGGFRETALIGRVVLVRGTGPDGRRVSRALDVEQTLKRGARELVHLAPHDVIYVPRTGIAEADIWVEQHFTQLFPFFRGAGGKMSIAE